MANDFLSKLNSNSSMIFSTLGDIASRTGDAVYGVSQARFKLYENQINEVFNLTQDNLNAQLEAYVANAPEADLPTFYNNAKTNVWDVYSSVDELKRNTNNRFSDEVYEEAYRRIQNQLKPKFESKMKTYENVSSKLALVSQFESNFSIEAVNGNWVDTKNARKSAKSFGAIYNDFSDKFNGFEYVNDNGVYETYGSKGNQLLMINGFTKALDDFTKEKARLGALETTEEFTNEFDSWWKTFSSEMGFDDKQAKNHFDSNRNSIKTYYEAYKSELYKNAEESKQKAFNLISQDENKYITNSEIISIMKDSGLGDYETNYYSNQALAEVVSLMYDVNVQKYEEGVTDVFDSFVKGKLVLYGLPGVDSGGLNYEKFLKNGVAHKYDGEGNTADVSASDWSTLNYPGDNAENKKAIAKINEFIDQITSPTKSTYQFNFEDVSRSLANKMGYSDDYTASIVDKMLTERFLYETEQDNGLIKSQINNLNAIINSNDYNTQEKKMAVHQYYKMGYLDDYQYQIMSSSVEFGYKQEYSQVMDQLKLDLPQEIYSYVLGSPEAVKYIQDGIDSVKGNITGKEGQQMITDLRTKFSTEMSDRISTKSLSKAMTALTSSNFYKKGPLTQLGDYSVGEVMTNYYNGEYNYLGMNFLIEQVKPMVMTLGTGKVKASKGEELLESIWALNGYTGTYKESKSDYKKEICEMALLIASCNVANDKTLNGFIDGALGESTTNILVYDQISGSYSPAVMSNTGIGVILESTGSNEPMFRIFNVAPGKVKNVKEDGMISFDSNFISIDSKAFPSTQYEKEVKIGEYTYGQETYDRTQKQKFYSTIKDNEYMMDIVNQINESYRYKTSK